MNKNKIYLEKIEANLAQYDAKLAGLKAKGAEIRADMKLEYISQTETLEKNRAGFMDKYKELKKSNDQAWDDVKAGTEKAWTELEESIEKAVSRFK
jgi:hypothetical protein